MGEKVVDMNPENEELLAGYENRENICLAFRQKLRRGVLEMLDKTGFKPASISVVLTEKTDACQNYRGEVIKIEIQSKRVDLQGEGHHEVWSM